jgi:hypothetical protein
MKSPRNRGLATLAFFRLETELGLNHATPEIFVVHLVGTVSDVEETWSD